MDKKITEMNMQGINKEGASKEERADRIGMYLLPHMNNYLFDELSDGYLEKAGVKDILSAVPVPVSKDMTQGVTVLNIAKNMAFVLGVDPNFKYAENYRAYILRNFDERFADAMISLGIEGINKNDYDYAAIMFRSAFIIDPENAAAYYYYGRACKFAYESGEEEEFIGRFKAEALEAFEIATMKGPELTEAFYYLGYAYVNMGLYIKAKLTWEEYVKNADRELASAEISDEEKKELTDCRKEIKERIAQLVEPVKIEEGYNLILSSRFEEGAQILEKYTEGQYQSWWPLWHYLGVAYEGLREDEKAISCYKKVLTYSPSNTDTMEALVKLYEKAGDSENVKKYTSKLAIVKANREAEKEEMRAENGNNNLLN